MSLGSKVLGTDSPSLRLPRLAVWGALQAVNHLGFGGTVDLRFFLIP